MSAIVDLVAEGRKCSGNHLHQVKRRSLTIVYPVELIDEAFE